MSTNRTDTEIGLKSHHIFKLISTNSNTLFPNLSFVVVCFVEAVGKRLECER